MMRLHALQCVYEKAPAFEVQLSAFRDDTAFDFAPWPKCVPH